jgi:hypothetical protein
LVIMASVVRTKMRLVFRESTPGHPEKHL